MQKVQAVSTKGTATKPKLDIFFLSDPGSSWIRKKKKIIKFWFRAFRLHQVNYHIQWMNRAVFLDKVPFYTYLSFWSLV